MEISNLCPIVLPFKVGLEDSADWSGDLICRGCDQQTDSCCCKQVSKSFEVILAWWSNLKSCFMELPSQVTSSFHTAMERLGHLGLVERLSGDTVVETVEERIKEQVSCFWIRNTFYFSSFIRFRLAGDHLIAVTWLLCSRGLTGERF